MSGAVLREILGGPVYIGPVVGAKQEYQVFRTGRADYVVFSKSNRGTTSFHMTFVTAARVKALRELCPRKGTTSGSMLKERKVAEMFGTEDRAALYFEVLTTLYVLAAMGVVEIKVGEEPRVYSQGSLLTGDRYGFEARGTSTPLTTSLNSRASDFLRVA